MHKTLQGIIESLNDLESSILKASKDNRTMTEMWGWNYPPLTRRDLANLAKNLSRKISEVEIDEISEDIQPQLDEISIRIGVFKKHTLQNLFNGNGHQAVPIYLSLIEWCSSTIEPLYSWQILHDNKALPANLSRRLRSIQSELNEIVPNKENLQTQIDLIQKATEAAESLPTDLESLKEARGKVSKISSDSAECFGKIDTYLKQVESISKLINDKRVEADKLVAQCEDAYKITTTKGLAGAFDQRAKSLSNSLIFWVVGLIMALIAGICIGSIRFEALNSAIDAQNDVGFIWIQIFLSMLSLSAPVWFAWIATKQITQRFKLSEDYAFKATVAKAYEGYRREAARIDVDLEARLFGSALTRLEEAPLRLVEHEHHGSPLHELVSSPQFQKAIDKVPELKEKFMFIVNRGKKVEKADTSIVNKD